MTNAQTIINHLLEAEDDLDSDWKQDLEVHGHAEVDDWLRTVLPRYGFTYRDMGCKCWEKEIGRAIMADLKGSAREGEVLMVRYEGTVTGRWQNKEMISVPCGQLVLDKLREWRIIR